MVGLHMFTTTGLSLWQCTVGPYICTYALRILSGLYSVDGSGNMDEQIHFLVQLVGQALWLPGPVMLK